MQTILTILAILTGIVMWIWYILFMLIINGLFAWFILWIGSLIFGYNITLPMIGFCAVVMTLLRR